ncbi:MAG: FAD-dependent oxidoreductase [Acetobacteraceae bacterium]|nr:FAD-dependent oxidoreductase [Acetobacteraceae bacterium]
MPSTYVQPRYPFRPPSRATEEARLVVVGAGLVGLTAALDLARRGHRVVVLDDDDTVSTGSRAICFAKRTLEIMGRLGLGARFLDKGITWNTGRVFHREREAYSFDLLPEQAHEYPAFVNLQQYHAEQWLVEACEATGRVELRWKHKATGVENRADGARLTVETPDGSYALHAEWLLACDGARSFIREALGLPFTGQVFRDRFLIADVVMNASFPTERWFWFDPPFHPGQSVLLHKQPDGVWRIDFQLGWDADPELEKQPDRVRARVAAMLGPQVPFDLEWVSVYTFRCRRMERFRHGRVFFLGDAAHQVSPFGARGGNGGVQDADNLGWKLAAVLAGEAGEALLDSYDAERIPAADENILNSTRSTDFITPKNEGARAWRDAVLELAHELPMARPFVNSGRLSRPWSGQRLAADAPVLRGNDPDWLLRHIGAGWTLVAREVVPESIAGVTPVLLSDTPRPGALHDHSGLAARRLDLAPGACVLYRPDQAEAARFSAPDIGAIEAARRQVLAA